MTISASVGQNVDAGSFSYTNMGTRAEQLVSVVISVSGPSALASLTVTEGSQTATVSPVAASNTLTFSPPINVAAGATVSFAITAETARSVSAIAQRIIYAGMLAAGNLPIGPLGGGMMLLGMMLMPMDIRRRRRAIVMALAAIALMVTVAGCAGGGGSSGGAPSVGSSRAVHGSGTLNNPMMLSTIKVTSSSNSITTVLHLSGIEFVSE